MTDTDDLWACKPVLTHARRGWMARTPDSHPYRIAVIERTYEEAEAAFAVALAAWKELHERQEPPTTGVSR